MNLEICYEEKMGRKASLLLKNRRQDYNFKFGVGGTIIIVTYYGKHKHTDQIRLG